MRTCSIWKNSRTAFWSSESGRLTMNFISHSSSAAVISGENEDVGAFTAWSCCQFNSWVGGDVFWPGGVLLLRSFGGILAFPALLLQQTGACFQFREGFCSQRCLLPRPCNEVKNMNFNARYEALTICRPMAQCLFQLVGVLFWLEWHTAHSTGSQASIGTPLSSSKFFSSCVHHDIMMLDRKHTS